MRLLTRLFAPPASPRSLPRAAPASVELESFMVSGLETSDAAGRAVVTLIGPPRGERWELESAAVDSPAGTARIYRNAEAASNLIAVAPISPNALDRDHPQSIWPGGRIVIVFAGAGASAVCTARIEGRRVRVG